MEKTSVYKYFAVGFNYHYLLTFGSKDAPVHGSYSLIERMEELFDFLETLNLRVTNQAAGKLREILTKIKTLPKDAKVDDALSREVRDATIAIDKTLDAELQLRNAFIITPKKVNVEYLLEKPQELFTKDVYLSLPKICQYDFSEACKSIAFGVPTAGAFHLMRATEGTLRFYYESIVKRGRVERLLWGPIIEHLRKRRDCDCKTLLDHLDHIRENFRNPTQHPDAKYDIDEVQDLLSVCVDTINRMVKNLFEKKLIGKSPPSLGSMFLSKFLGSLKTEQEEKQIVNRTALGEKE